MHIVCFCSNLYFFLFSILFIFWSFVFFVGFWFVFLFQLLNPVSRNFNFFVCESMCIVVNNFTKAFFHLIISVLWLLINFFQHDADIENCIVGFFSQVIFQSHHVLFLCYESKPLESPFPFQSTKSKKHFHFFINYMILHHAIVSSFYEFCFNKNLKDWVKARCTTW
jgi:hypothetical protein